MLNVNQLFIALTVLTILAGRSAAQLNDKCGECLANGIACLDEEHFATCFANAPTANRISCPPGSVCTAQSQICLPATQGNAPACRADACGSCTATADRFACLDETRYGFCFTGSQPDAKSIHDCPSGYVCNVNSLQICESTQSTVPSCLGSIATTASVDSSTPTIPGDTTYTSTEITSTDTNTDVTVTVTKTVSTPVVDSTPQTIESPTTTSAPRSPNTFCAAIAQKGNFKPDADSTCKNYIKCYIVSGEFVGWEYTCNSGYFSETLGDCQSERPATC